MEAIEAQLAQSQAVTQDLLAGGLPRLFLIEDEYKHALLKAELMWLKKLVSDLKSKAITWSPQWLQKVAAELEGANRA